MEDLIRASQAAGILGCTVWTVHNMAKDGRLTPVVKVPGPTGAYLFHRSDVEALAAAEAAS